MVFDEHDETIDRIADALRPLPEVDPSAKARLLVAVAADRERGRAPRARPTWRHVRWAGAIAGLAAAAAFATLIAHERPRDPSPTAARPLGEGSVVAAARPTSTLAAADPRVTDVQPVQLVLHAAGAHRVSVVGDFTQWDERRAPMTHDAASGLWSVTLALRPGRHVYAFLVDDSIWVRDPRAPVAADADFGRPGSVLLVGRP